MSSAPQPPPFSPPPPPPPPFPRLASSSPPFVCLYLNRAPPFPRPPLESGSSCDPVALIDRCVRSCHFLYTSPAALASFFTTAPLSVLIRFPLAPTSLALTWT